MAQVVADFPTLAGGVGHLSRHWIFNVLYASRDHKGKVLKPQPAERKQSLFERAREICFGWSCPEYRLDEEAKKLLAKKKNQDAKAAAGGRGRKRKKP
jgi:hypothetical protein